jgi:hypothetical protein
MIPIYVVIFCIVVVCATILKWCTWERKDKN